MKQLAHIPGWYAFPGENGLKVTDLIKDQLQAVINKSTTPEQGLATMSKGVQALLPK